MSLALRCRYCILGAHGDQFGIDTLLLGNEDDNTEVAIAGNKDHFEACRMFLQDFEDGSEPWIAETNVIAEVVQNGAAAFCFQ